jgi:hypothetical protein
MEEQILTDSTNQELVNSDKNNKKAPTTAKSLEKQE